MRNLLLVILILSSALLGFLVFHNKKQHDRFLADRAWQEEIRNNRIERDKRAEEKRKAEFEHEMQMRRLKRGIMDNP